MTTAQKPPQASAPTKPSSATTALASAATATAEKPLSAPTTASTAATAATAAPACTAYDAAAALSPLTESTDHSHGYHYSEISSPGTEQGHWHWDNKRLEFNHPADEDLALKTKLLATLGWRLASCGAETRLIVQSVKKMAYDLGCHAIGLSISRNGILVKLRNGQKVSVEYMEIRHFVINMDSLARLHEICLQVSEGKLTDLHKIFFAIRAVRPRHYNHKHIIVIEALAGAGFAYLNGGHLGVCISALVGGLCLMFFRFLFIKRGFFETFTFMLSACIGSLVASLVAHYGFAVSSFEVTLAATATTLLLVPGFPLINGFLDIFKGYVTMGFNRLVIAVVVVMSAAIGLLTSTYISNLIFQLL